MLALGATDEAERYFNRAIAGGSRAWSVGVQPRALRWRSGKCTDAECQRVVASALRDAERTERALQWLREESGERGDDDARWSLRAESYARGPRARSVAVDQPRQRLWIADARGALAVVDLASGAARSIAIGVEPECAIALSDRWVLAAAETGTCTRWTESAASWPRRWASRERARRGSSRAATTRRACWSCASQG